jgi:phosphatidylglycerol:prolipoprotein diacylglycerol transferase
VLGVILGGRLGYVLFYKPLYYLAHPPRSWRCGRAAWPSTGASSACWWPCGCSVAQDRIAPGWPSPTSSPRWCRWGWPPGAWATSSTANSWGASPTACPGPWSSPGGRPAARHPSQLYQFALEGVSLFLILWWFRPNRAPAALISAVFLIGYGAFRFIAEFGREPDGIFGQLLRHVSMGQWLSLPMILIGVAMLAMAYRKKSL